MNILEQEDLIKGLPDQALFQQADNPTGDIPQFLVISEIQRRTDMRKRFEAAEPQPQTTAAQRIVSEGLGAAMAPQNSLPPPAMPAPPSNSVSQMDGSSPLMAQGMAAGGILGFSNGGGTSSYRAQGAGVVDDLLARLVSSGWDATKAGVAATAQAIRNLEPQSTRDIAVEEILSDPENYPNLNPLQRRREARKQVDESERLRPYREEQEAIRQGNLTAAAYIDKDQGSGLPQLPQIDPAALQAYTGTDYSPMGEIGIIDDSVIPIMPGGGGEVEQEVVKRTTDDIESFVPGTYLNPELVAEVGETVTQGEALKGAQTTENELLQKVLDSFESRRAGAEERLGRRRTESQDLINEIREEGKRDALSAALIQLGAGISSGDMSSGLREAGSAMTSANAVARDAARAEQRSMRDYEESVLGQVDQLGMEEAQFAFGAERDAQTRAEEIRQWEATHGLAQLNAKNDMIFKEAGLELQADKLENDAYIGREGLKNQITKMNNDLKISTDTSRREAMRTFTAVLDSIQDFIDELPAGTSAEEMEEIRNTQQARILSALRTSLGEEFYDAFMRDYKPVRGDATTSPSGVSITDFDT